MSVRKSLLKGTENVPKSIKIGKLMTKRAREIHELQKKIEESTATKLIFQRLPTHMRRRAMSHRVNRLPRNVREAHFAQMKKSGLPPKLKRPCRKFRRRPENLLQNYNQRQRKFIWLETHIWHAKRFHMINRWGYRLPFKPCDKSFRACYRATTKHCLLQDISYINCIELIGPKSVLINQLKLITSSNIGLTVAAKAFQKGNREGETILYHKNSYPYRAIGQVKFMWKAEEIDTENSCLWLWAHSAFYIEVINCLRDIFNANEVKLIKDNATYFNPENGVKINELKHSLNRFRLTGPLAHSVLVKSLLAASEENLTPWLVQYNKTPRNKDILKEQSAFWQSINNIDTVIELSPQIILNLVVTDPRFSWPRKRTKATIKDILDEELCNIPDDIKFGPLWCEEIRSEVSNNVLNTSQFTEKRKNNLVHHFPSIPLDASAVPIILVQQPGNKESYFRGYGSGWDIILPADWGRPFWLTFIMWGARAGGLRESRFLRFEQGLTEFLYPDTKAGEIEEERLSEFHKTKYFNLPPNKRCNYNKLGITSPFSLNWKTLIREWNQKETVEQFYVMRDRKQLTMLQNVIENKNTNLQDLNIDFNENCLIPVRINFLCKGNAGRFGIICLPQKNDYTSAVMDSPYGDDNQKTRKDLRDAHKKILKRMKRRRIRARESGDQAPSSKELIEEYSEKMKSLWLPEPEFIRNSCSREIIGFVTVGDFSFTFAGGKCIGYLVLKSLQMLLKTEHKNYVLVKGITNGKYKLAKLEIIL